MAVCGVVPVVALFSDGVVGWRMCIPALFRDHYCLVLPKNRKYDHVIGVAASTCCNGIALNILEKAGNYLGTGIGIVLVLLGRRILDEKHY